MEPPQCVRSLSQGQSSQEHQHHTHHAENVPPGWFSRSISLNAKYMVVFKNMRGKMKFAQLARQVCSEYNNGLYVQVTRLPSARFSLEQG